MRSLRLARPPPVSDWYVGQDTRHEPKARAPPPMCVEFTIFGLKCQFPYFQENMEVPLNLCNSGVQDKCVNN
jgi:hypothetical protein